MNASVEVREFAETMTSRMRSFDVKMGTNNFVTDTTIDQAFESLKSIVGEIIEGLLSKTKWIDCKEHDEDMIEVNRTEYEVIEGKVITKTKAVDLANMAMVLWSKL